MLQQAYAHDAYEALASTVFAHDKIREAVPTFGLPPEERVIVSYGWIGTNIKGVCILGAESVPGADAVIFVRPEDWDTAENMLAVLVHEMIHAGLPKEKGCPGHDGNFQVIADILGMGKQGKEPGAELIGILKSIAENLPDFPAAPLAQTTPDAGIARVIFIPRPSYDGRKYTCDCGVWGFEKADMDPNRLTCSKCGQTLTEMRT